MKGLMHVAVAAVLVMSGMNAMAAQTFSVPSQVGSTIAASANWCTTGSGPVIATSTGTISVGFDMTITAFSVSMPNIQQSGPNESPYANQSYNMGLSITGPDGATKQLVPLYYTYAYEYWSSGSLANIEFRGQVSGGSLVGLPSVYNQTLSGVSMGSYPNSSWWASDNLTYYNGKSSKGTWKLNVTSEDYLYDANDWIGCPHTVTVGAWQVNFQGTYGIAAITNLANPYTMFASTSINLGTSQTQFITVQNTGAQSLQITGLQGLLGATGDYSVTTPLPLTIAPGTSANVNIQFLPTSVGSRVAQFSLVTSGLDATATPPGQQNFTINMLGTAVSPLIDARFNNILYRAAVAIKDSAVKFFKISNPGNATLKVYQWDASGAPVGPGLTFSNFIDPNGRLTSGASDYSVVYPPQLVNGLEWDLAGGATDSIGLKFKPTAEGTRIALLNLRSNAPRVTTSQGVVSSDSLGFILQGVGLAPKMDMTVQNFGAVNQGDSARANICIRNVGTGNLTISSQTLVNGDVRQFSIVQPFPRVIKPDSSACMQLQLRPDSIGLLFATLRLETNCLSSDSVKLVDMQGIGRPVARVTMTPRELFRPDTADVGGLSVSSCVSIHNTGSTALIVDQVNIVGNDAVNYKITSPMPMQVNVGQTKQLCFAFHPQLGHNAGSTASAVIKSNNAGGGSDTISLLGFACQRSSMAAPESLFVNVVIDTSETRQDNVTLNNPGNCPVVIQSMHITGIDSGLYKIVGSAPTALAPGGSAQITVEFKSDRVNLQTPIASLVVRTDSPIDSVVTLPLLARGCYYEVLSVPQTRSVLFANDQTPVGGTSRQTVLLQNTGCVPLQLTNVTINGVDAKEYAVVYAPAVSAPIPSHAIDSVVVAINRLTAGDKTARLHVLTNSNELKELVYDLGVLQPDGIRQQGAAVSTFALFQNYPNPFNPTTLIAYDVAKRGLVKLEVLNPLGQRMALLENTVMDAGRYHAEFNASTLPSGTYLYRLIADGYTATRVMNLIK